MNPGKSVSTKTSGWLACLLIAAVLAILFWKCFLPEYTHFSNDGPLGLQKTAWLNLPQGFLGQWCDIYSVGWSGGAAWPETNSLIHWMLGSVGYSKFLIPISLFLLGYGAYFFFKRSGLTTGAAILGGLAACLTTNFFSDACWGAAPAVIAFGVDFLALGALAKREQSPIMWLLVCPALAGLAVGLNVMEAADIGMLFSVLVAIYAIYQSFVENGSPLPRRLAFNVARTAVVTVFAVFIAIYSIFILLGMNVKGIVGTQQDVQTKAQRWDFATQWSLPKRETLSLIIPGLFGDRVDYSDERAYWGGVGRAANWERFYHDKLQPGDTVQLVAPGSENAITVSIDKGGNLALPSTASLSIKAAGLTRFELQSSFASTPLKGTAVEYAVPGEFLRHTGRGFYFGLLVVMVGLWAALQSFRKSDSVFTSAERKMVWFWSVVALVALLLAHGRFSPLAGLYYWLYTVLPYASTVRSPEKFLHVMNFAMLVLFAYGVHGINRRYFEAPLVEASFGVRLKSWWSRAAAFDRRWVIGSAFAIVGALLGWLIYSISRPAVEQYLQDVQFNQDYARAISGYSLQQVAWFVLFLVLNCGLLLLIFSGTFAGPRAIWGSILLGVLLVADLGRADMQFNNPWKDAWDYGFWNYKEKYEIGDLNQVCAALATKPYAHRVAKLPFRGGDLFINLYDIEWLQQIFPYYNIQALDIAQLPRMPQDMEAFQLANYFPGITPYARYWELTNTRFLVGPAALGPNLPTVDVMNQQLDPVRRRFRLAGNFRVVPKPGIEVTRALAELTVVPMQQGDPALNDPRVEKDALIEFTGALPRAKLYSNWETNTPAAIHGFTANGLDANQLHVLGLTGTNDFLTLQKLMSPSFNPASTVLLDQPITASPGSNAVNQSAGDVEFASYAPTDIKLKANATNPCVLLLNDRYDPMWQVWVDGNRAQLLRCNYIMRGVFLEPGQHQVEFRFRQPTKMLYVNIAAIAVGVVLLGYAVVATRKNKPDA